MTLLLQLCLLQLGVGSSTLPAADPESPPVDLAPIYGEALEFIERYLAEDGVTADATTREAAVWARLRGRDRGALGHQLRFVTQPDFPEPVLRILERDRNPESLERILGRFRRNPRHDVALAFRLRVEEDPIQRERLFKRLRRAVLEGRFTRFYSLGALLELSDEEGRVQVFLALRKHYTDASDPYLEQVRRIAEAVTSERELRILQDWVEEYPFVFRWMAEGLSPENLQPFRDFARRQLGENGFYRRLAGAIALARLGEPRGLQTLRDLAREEDARSITRAEAIFACHFAGEEAIDYLREVLESGAGLEVPDQARLAAFQALAQLGDESGLEWLASGEYRRRIPAVLPYLERLGTPRAIQQLIAIVRDDLAEPWERLAAAGAVLSLADSQGRFQPKEPRGR